MLKTLTLRPGIDKQISPTLDEGGWSDGNLVRFPYGVPQPIGGWQRFSQLLVQGVARALHAWSQLDATRNLAAGTNLRLSLFSGGGLFDLTPTRDLPLAANSLSTTAGSPLVQVTAPNHGCSVGDILIVPPGTAIDNLSLGGEYAVTAVPSAATFVITSNDGPALSTVTTGSAPVTLQALLPAGNADAVQANGWGAGSWGAGTWGTPRSATVDSGAARLWSLDNWGEELIACVRQGGIYNWKPSSGPTVRAAAIPGAPTQVLVALVGMPERHLICFGCNQGGVFDPMLVAWSDVEDYTTWTATANNSAGSFRLAAGNGIVGVLPISQEILVFTESNVYAMRFLGLPYVYGFVQVEADHTGLIGQNAAVTAGNGLVFWMGLDSFWTYSGAARPLPCDVWDDVFGNMNRLQAAKITAGSNAAFNEVWWFYPSASSTENDSLVIFNYVNNTWSLGALGRTAWLDLDILPNPTAAAATGVVYSHEVGTDADGAPLPATVTSGFMMISDGDEMSFVNQLYPDFSDQAGNVQVTVMAKKYPNDEAFRSKGPFVMAKGTRFLSPRVRGRQLALTFASSGLGAFWRLGAVRTRLAPSGQQ